MKTLPAKRPAPAPARPPAKPAPLAKSAVKVAPAIKGVVSPAAPAPPPTRLSTLPSFATAERATPPPPASGRVDPQFYNAVMYGVFAAVNKSFGSYGASVVKNAALRIMEYSHKCGWGIPPKSKDPLRALREFFDQLSSLGYAESVTFTKKGDDIVCEIKALRDWNAVSELRDLHYPTLPIFAAELVTAFLDQFFKLNVAAEPLAMDEEKRTVSFRFTYHSKAEPAQSLTIPESTAVDLED